MQPTGFTCSRCNAPLPPGVSQCPNCGMTFAAPVPMAPMPPYMAPPPPKSSNPTGIIIGIVVALFVGVFLIGILAAILFPVFVQAREKARIKVSESNLRQIGLATQMYLQDYDNRYPPMDTEQDFEAAVTSYVPPQKDGVNVFVEPGANVPYAVNTDMSHKALADLDAPATTKLMWETVPHSRGKTVVLYADGHVEVTSSVD